MVGKLNKQYRAFIDYRKVTGPDSDLKRDRKTFKTLDQEQEFFESIKINCTIDEDWVEFIESKIEYVTKAVNEERQFIETIGEVVPIEKVKKVSKDSVKHLAKHSNLITKMPEDEDDILPEKLYMVEKISDYTVYENRFLYMLLCYLRDFIDLRVNKINEALATYKSDFKMTKVFETKSRTFKFETSFIEDRKDNPYPLINEKTKSVLERINTFSHDVQALLATDLMIQVSKSPMIKPPITKTNVLKMNNNFKNAVALYEYLAGYDKKGYSFEEVKMDLHPFEDPMADEIMELVSLTSFLSFKYGNDIESLLKSEYEEEERIKRLEEIKHNADLIKALKKRVKESGMGMEEYMLLLEKQNRHLEKDSADLVIAKNEILNLKEMMSGLEKENKILSITIDDLKKQIEGYKEEIIRINKEHEEEITNLNNKHLEEVTDIKEKHIKEVTNLNEKHVIEISDLTEKYETEIDTINAEHHDELIALEDTFEKEKKDLYADYNQHLDQLTQKNEVLADANEQIKNKMKQNDKFVAGELAKMAKEKDKLIAEYNKSIKETIAASNKEVLAAQELTAAAIEETRYANAKVNALKLICGMLTDEDDFTSKERFFELDLQRKAFNKLYKEEWKRTKQRIKKEIFEQNNPLEKTELEEVLESETLSEEKLQEIEDSLRDEMNEVILEQENLDMEDPEELLSDSELEILDEEIIEEIESEILEEESFEQEESGEENLDEVEPLLFDETI